MDNKHITNRVEIYLLKNNETKANVAACLGVSRPTLDKRLIKHNWRKLEIKHILKNM